MKMDPPRGPDAGTLMIRAIRAAAQDAGIVVAIRAIISRPWASATFIGLHHHVVVEAAATAALNDWLARLPDAEWTVRGHLVADLAIVETGSSGGITAATLAILTIAED